MQSTASNVSQVQNAINKLQVADAAYGEMIALGQKGLEVANRATDAGADTSAITAQVAALTAGITSIDANTEYIGVAVLGDVTAPTVGAGALTVTPTAVTPPATDNVAGYTAFLNGTVDLRAENAGNIAALQNTLQVLNSVGSSELAAMSQAQDTDIAKEMMALTSANIMTEAATAMLAQAMQLPNAVLRLVQ
jgi:flagellin